MTDQEWHEKLPDRKHGRNDTYCTYGCRCSLCRSAHAEKKRIYSGKTTARLLRQADDSWMKDPTKNCQDMNPNVFFTTAGEGTEAYQGAVDYAKGICDGCCVLSDCLEYAIATRQEGVWGGTDEKERRRIVRRRRKS